MKANRKRRPAEERGARIETQKESPLTTTSPVAPQKNAGRGLKHFRKIVAYHGKRGRPAEERGARIETT